MLYFVSYVIMSLIKNCNLMNKSELTYKIKNESGGIK